MVESEEGTHLFHEKDEIPGYVAVAVAKHTRGRISIREDVGARSWFSRLLFRMHPRMFQGHLAMEWSDSIASLIFFDERASEYRAKDSEQLVHPDDQTRTAIAHGELSPHPVDQCLRLDRALQAIGDYIHTGSRPSWLNYEYLP